MEKGGLDLNKVAIIPTGDEILNGTVLDTNSPAVLSLIIKNNPGSEVLKCRPVIDDQEALFDTIDEMINCNYDLIVFIGGSGGGHIYTDSLAKDLVSELIISKSERYSSFELYGYNGHLWSRLVVGKNKDTLIINLPGPHKEAVSAMEAFFDTAKNTLDIKIINENMADAVKKNYG